MTIQEFEETYQKCANNQEFRFLLLKALWAIEQALKQGLEE